MQHTRRHAAEGVLQMKQRPRIYYTDSQKALMWERWQKGETLQQIAQLFDRNHSSIQGILAETGGIRPAQRRRSRLALTLAEREEISAAWWQVTRCARSQRARPSTLHDQPRDPAQWWAARLSSEPSRPGGLGSGRRPKTCKLAQNRALARIVATSSNCEWSPEQIAGWLKRTYPDDEAFRCHTRPSIAACSFRPVAP